MGSGGKRVTTLPPVRARCSASWAGVLDRCSTLPSDILTCVWTCVGGGVGGEEGQQDLCEWGAQGQVGEEAVTCTRGECILTCVWMCVCGGGVMCLGWGGGYEVQGWAGGWISARGFQGLEGTAAGMGGRLLASSKIHRPISSLKHTQTRPT